MNINSLCGYLDFFVNLNSDKKLNEQKVKIEGKEYNFQQFLQKAYDLLSEVPCDSDLYTLRRGIDQLRSRIQLEKEQGNWNKISNLFENMFENRELSLLSQEYQLLEGISQRLEDYKNYPIHIKQTLQQLNEKLHEQELTVISKVFLEKFVVDSSHLSFSYCFDPLLQDVFYSELAEQMEKELLLQIGYQMNKLVQGEIKKLEKKRGQKLDKAAVQSMHHKVAAQSQKIIQQKRAEVHTKVQQNIAHIRKYLPILHQIYTSAVKDESAFIEYCFDELSKLEQQGKLKELIQKGEEMPQRLKHFRETLGRGDQFFTLNQEWKGMYQQNKTSRDKDPYLGQGICFGACVNYASQRATGKLTENDVMHLDPQSRYLHALYRREHYEVIKKGFKLNDDLSELAKSEVQAIENLDDHHILMDDVHKDSSVESLVDVWLDINKFKELRAQYLTEAVIPIPAPILEKLGVKPDILIEFNKEQSIKEFLTKTLDAIIESHQGKPLHVVLQLSKKNESEEVGEPGHAIYLSLQSPYEIQDINYPGFLGFKSSNLNTFKIQLLLWLAKNPYQVVNGLISLQPLA